MDVAVGGTSGWFPDGAGGKPWLDNSAGMFLFCFLFLLVFCRANSDCVFLILLDAMFNFANAQDTWFSTWPLDVTKRGMAV